MSATLLLKIAAPIFAFAVSGLVWGVAGPLAAGLSLVTFLLGLVTSELDHMRWKTVETGETSAEDSALSAFLAVGQAAPLAPASAPPARPRHVYRCQRNGLAIGSGSRRRSLAERVVRRPVAPSVEETAALEDELFEPLEPVFVDRAEPVAVQPALVAPARVLRAEPPPPTVTILSSAYGARAGRR